MAPPLDPVNRWNAYTTLNLDPRCHTTCIGTVKTKNRACLARVWKLSRDQACKVLDDLSSMPQDVRLIEARPNDLARLLLCKKFHQNQVNEIVGSWRPQLIATSPSSNLRMALDESRPLSPVLTANILSPLEIADSDPRRDDV
jgi:hypothetical protein